MPPEEVIKGEADDNESHRLLGNVQRDGAVGQLPVNLPECPRTALGGANSTEGSSLTSKAHTFPPSEPNSLAKLEMKPIFVPSPWPTYLTLPKQSYRIYASAADVDYTPQTALEQAFLMLKSVEDCTKQLNTHTKLRKIMWRKKISELKAYKHGHTTIAICGGTGAGKSSLINAVLDAQILPTSDSRACTSAVVEIGYHRHPFYSAEVDFITRDELRTDMETISGDVQSKLNPDDDPQFDAEFITHEKVVWQRTHATFPSLSREELAARNLDEIIDSDERVASVLGSTTRLEGRTLPEFRDVISPYITAEPESHQSTGPQLWSLVKRVRLYVKAAALESGSRLVDLPGTGDVNEARNRVAADYLKEADYIWIVASIKRAADESAAGDLIDENLKTDLRHNKYDHQHVAFIATHTDQVSESDIIKSLGLHQDPDLLEIQAELTNISEALRQGKSEAQTPTGQLEVLRLQNRRTELKKQRRRTLARKRNEHMKQVIQRKFRAGVGRLEPNPLDYLDLGNSSAPTSTIGDDCLDVPVFTCSAFDYAGINMEDDYDPICFDQVEDTEIPRLQNHCYELGLPAQREPVLQMFQGLENLLCRLREYAGADGHHNYADGLTLANKWESDIPSVSDQASFLSIINGISMAEYGQKDETNKPSLRSVVEHAISHNTRDSCKKGFSYEVCQAMKNVTEECVKYLKQEIRGALEDLFVKGAAEAEAKALATHDLFAPPITHWATYRATLRRNGEFKRNLNEKLVAPITQRQLEVWPGTFRKPLLAPMANEAKLQIEKVLSQVKQSSPLTIQALCERQCHVALQEAQATIHEIERGLKKLIIREQRALSKFLVPSVREILGPAYREAVEIRGRGSTGKQKAGTPILLSLALLTRWFQNLFRESVGTLRHAMFTESVTRLMEKLDYIPESIGLILPVALNEVACQAEVNLASLWQIPQLSKEDIEKRKEFVREADNILCQARLWLTKILIQ
ncbi:unnamed protein product [Rhizoctonia solani]|uniref:Dynamin N-terminal domain-containing protein n=1 Tax=Rhizoctonia solani TaxID=456999 RepID=A0A8H3CSK2_9AGAM|nr:unnamed protein product [Rhizoctonia solani]